MVGFKDEGVVLKRRDFGEADRLLTLLTRSHGKLSVLAKGVRRITSRRSGNVELLNRVIVYLHPGKNFYLLTEAESLDTFQKIKEDLTLSTVAFHILEITDKLAAEGQENRNLYQLLVGVLKILSVNPRQIFIRAFEVKILSILGFADFQSLRFHMSTHSTSLSVDPEFIEGSSGNTLSLLQNSDWPEIAKIEIDQREALELERLLRYHLEKVIEGKLKSRQMLKKL